jgi:energy-coupling factor transporter ATP-binding protein EcfA2/ABC-type multidrug transport system permease subunit
LTHISDSLIGTPPAHAEQGHSQSSGISGGERRRVSIAMELLTAPAILFLDEPTSGLDAANAARVIEALALLARKQNRTIIFSIHQPRSDLFLKFDRLLLLGLGGHSLYSGLAGNSVASYLATIGLPCPAGYNMADHLLDLHKSHDENISDALLQNNSRHPSSFWRSLFSSDIYAGTFAPSQQILTLQRRSRVLADYFLHSSVGQSLKQQLGTSQTQPSFTLSADSTVPSQLSLLRQIDVLSLRAFLQLYRNPYLLRAQYGLVIGLSLFCGLLFYRLPNDLSGVQNRLGYIFFALAFYAFSSLASALSLFSRERTFFMMEASHQHSYSVLAYFFSKLWMDLLPLRIFPPIVFASISYFLIGLYPDALTFAKFTLVLALFNIVVATFCFSLAVKIKARDLANLVATLSILFSMLFGGFLLNKDRLPPIFVLFKYISFFNYAFECLIVNELININLKDNSIVEIEVPGVVILQQLGFHPDAFWSDTIILSIIGIVFLLLTLVFLLRSSRASLL